jgi:hypothetical protein
MSQPSRLYFEHDWYSLRGQLTEEFLQGWIAEAPLYEIVDWAKGIRAEEEEVK